MSEYLHMSKDTFRVMLESKEVFYIVFFNDKRNALMLLQECHRKKIVLLVGTKWSQILASPLAIGQIG